MLISDINSANHLGADRLFAIVIEAQMRFFAHLGYEKSKELDGVGYIMADTEFIFKAESVYADQLRIDVAVDNLQAKSFELKYRITNTTKGQLAAVVKAGMVFIDYDSGVVSAMPAAFRAKIT